MEEIVNVVKLLGLYCILIRTLVCTVKIHVNNDSSGFIGSNGSALICTITRLKADRFLQLTFIANKLTIITIGPSMPTPELSNNGKYLEGRVILGNLTNIATNTTHITSEASVIFTDLQCIDDNLYSCELGYGDSNNGNQITQIQSKTSKITVKGLPSRPSVISIFHNDQMLKKDQFVESDNITIYCTGEVGYYTNNLTVVKIRSNGNIDSINGDVFQSNQNNFKCTTYQNLTITTNLTMKDNGILFRCAVSTSIIEDGMFIETSPLDVEYSVQTPTIETYPNSWSHPPVRLHCIGSGNPEPIYTWYRNYNNSWTDSFQVLSKNKTITLFNISGSGVYRCEVHNVIRQIEYRKSAHIAIEFKEDPNSNVGVNTQTSCNCVPAVLGGVFGTLGFCLLTSIFLFIWQFRGKRLRDMDNGRPTIMNSINQSGLSVYEGIHDERTEHHYDELRQRHESKYDNTQIQETRR